MTCTPHDLRAACRACILAASVAAFASTAGARPQDAPVQTSAPAAVSAQQIEKELRKIRATFFRSGNPNSRAVGIEALKQFTDPVAYAPLIEIFGRDHNDVRGAVIDHLASLGNDQADAALTHTAIFHRDEWLRQRSLDRLDRRVREAGFVSGRVRWIVDKGLRSSDQAVVAAGAETLSQLRIWELLPVLIAAQASASRSASAGEPPALAYIVVGTQQAYVADLQPVVGESAVAFDPQVAVLTEGTVLRINGATVMTYRTIVQSALVRTTSAAWGRPTDALGFDQRKWYRWYRDEFLPYRLAADQGPQPIDR